MKLYWDHITWGPHNLYYFYWWNWLPKKVRHWGYEKTWHDGPHVLLGFWFFNMSWSTQWTTVEGCDFEEDEDWMKK